MAAFAEDGGGQISICGMIVRDQNIEQSCRVRY